MNIFVLDEDHTRSSEYHVNSHIIKMPLESAQMLCTCVSHFGLETPYKPTHKKHPCNLWLLESLDNFYWLCDLGIALCKEYTFRYGKRHKCQDVIEWCRNNPPKLESKGLTKQPLAMPEECKKDSVISSYRNYYNTDKKHLHSWKNRNKPFWIEN
jgi:hypothetical protein